MASDAAINEMPREEEKVDVIPEPVPQWQTPEMEPLQLPQGTVLDVATCSNGGRMQRSRKAKRKDESLLDTLCAAIVQHQLGLSINCLLLLVFTHLLFPSLRPTTGQFFSFQYHDSKTGLYNAGWDDLKLVALWIVIFTALRAATMDYVLLPCAKYVGINKKKATIRFAEQAWMLIYYCVFWTLGTCLWYNSTYFFDLPAMWSNFPTQSMTGLLKFYYLAQFAFWIQQIVVVNIEERRKDHWQMFSHHIITCTLMLGSYGYYQTKVGNVILCIMDVVDIVLPAAKLLRYMGHQTACDIAFGVFIVTWLVARHVFYLAVCWSIYVDVPVVMPYGCYDVATGAKVSSNGGNEILSHALHAYRGTSDPVCFNESIHYSFLALLLALQVLTLIWFGMICRVAYGVLSGKGADDSRSDDEGEDGELEADDVFDQRDQIKDFAQKEPELQQVRYQQAREEEVGVEDLKFVRRPSVKKAAKRSKGRSSGISIPGHGDHKELLGRIGCDKPT